MLKRRQAHAQGRISVPGCAAVSNQGSYGAPASLGSSQSGRGRNTHGCWIRGVSPANYFPVAWPIRDASHPSALCSNLRTPFLEVIQGDSRNGPPGLDRSGRGQDRRSAAYLCGTTAIQSLLGTDDGMRHIWRFQVGDLVVGQCDGKGADGILQVRDPGCPDYRRRHRCLL